MKTSLLHHSSCMEIIQSQLIKFCVHLLLLFWKTTICCKSLSQQGNAQTHRHPHALPAKLAAEPYKGHNYANTRKCGRITFFFLFTLKSKIRKGSGSG